MGGGGGGMGVVVGGGVKNSQVSEMHAGGPGVRKRASEAHVSQVDCVQVWEAAAVLLRQGALDAYVSTQEPMAGVGRHVMLVCMWAC